MSTSFNTVVGNPARTAFTISLNGVANGNYVAATAVTLATLLTSPNRAPYDVIIDLEITPGTVSGNKLAKLFAQISMDGTNFSSGPTGGTTTTDEVNLYLLDVLPLNSNSTLQRRSVSLLSALGFIPYAIKPVVFNDSGAAFAGSGCAMYYTGISGDGS